MMQPRDLTQSADTSLPFALDYATMRQRFLAAARAAGAALSEHIHPLHGPDGARVGALCVVDMRPRRLNAAQLKMLQDLARLVEEELAPRVAQKAG